MSHTITLLKKTWFKLSGFLTLLLFLGSTTNSLGQSYTLSTVPPYTQNNGSSTITFNVETNSQPIKITQLGCTMGGSTTAQIWYRTTPISGTPGVSTANGWVMVASTGSFANTTLPAPTPIPATLSITIPPFTKYGFCINTTGNLRYLTGTVTPTTISDPRITIINSPGVGFGGTITGPIANRQFCGFVKYELISTGPVVILPPLASFFPSQETVNSIPNDTVWINSPYDLVATSTNASRNFWDLPNVSSLPFGYSRQNVGWTAQQYIDTAKYNERFKYTFPNRGFVPVRLLAVNSYKRDSLRDSVVKYIWVDTPNTAPKPNFFAARRKIGIGDYASLVDITSNGPFQWYWTYTPACNLCTTPPYFNNFFAGPTDQNPLFFGGDPGKFTVCLQAWNDRGWDTICKPDYIEVLNSINMCSGSGSDKSSEQEGFIFAASGPGLSYTRSQVSGCPGLLLEPCADSIILWVDRMKMLPNDSLVIHNGTSSTAPILKTIGGSNVNQLPTSILQNGIRGGSRLFVRFKLGTGNPTLPYDSAGFSIRWEAMPASYPKPTSIMVVPDSVFSLQPVLFNSASVGKLMQYSWDTDGNGVYDSAGATATRSFLVTAPQYKKICLVTYNCVGSDTTCKNVLFLPTTQKPVTRFEAAKVQGFNTDTFRFTDKSLFGPSTWKWTFTPGTAQFIMGTSSTSKDPMIRFTQRTKYTVKLAVTNQYGNDSLIKVDYVNIGAYDQPACLTDINLADGSIGITRVALESGLDTSTNAYNPCFQIVGGNQAASMYRGSKGLLTVVRPSTSSPMDRKAWIDFNMDGLFTYDELVMDEINAQNLTRIDTVRVSETQRIGTTRMRVGVTYAGTTLNPSVTFLGVFRDYTVNFPMDTVKPSISMIGSSTYYSEINKTYVDPGVISMDNIEGDISNKYETIGSVDTSALGPNYLKYIVKDLYGNVSDTLYRTVFVVLNQTGPSLSLMGQPTEYVEVYHSYLEPGYEAKDNQGNDISSSVIVLSDLDTGTLGSYGMIYTVVDAFGFSKEDTRTIVVGDTTKPSINPMSSPYIHQVGTALDLNKVVNLTDNYWSNSFITLTTTGSVDVNNVGSYFIRYSAEDNSGNISEEVLVEIIVKDTKAPTITLNGENPLNWDVKTSLVDPGVSVNDNYWPASTVVISKKGSVNTNVLGEYTLWYIATDPSGNKDSISRVVKVIDTSKPEVNLLNIYEVNIQRWKEYNDAPISLDDNYNSDAEMRASLIVTNSLPLNAEGKPFGDLPGLYSITYKIKDASGNESSLAKRIIRVGDPATGLSGVMNIDQLMSVYPNPSNGKINLRLASVQTEKIEISVFDMLGKEIKTSQMDGNNLQAQELDLTNQPKGIYLLKVKAGDRIYRTKLQIN